MMYAVLSLGLALLGGIVRLAQVLRLSAPLLYGALVITVFRPWYLAHTALADGVFLVLVGLAALSWVVTLIRAVRETIWYRRTASCIAEWQKGTRISCFPRGLCPSSVFRILLS